MFTWFRKSPIEPLPVAMSGIKLADRLLIVGCSDPRLIAALASKSGLTGRVCVVDRDDERAREAARIAEREGALVETAPWAGGQLPYPGESFDVAVVRDLSSQSGGDAPRVLRSIASALRPGGRCVVIEGAAKRGLAALLGGSQPPALSAEAVTAAFNAAGFLAVRTLTEREHMVFVEGVKRNV